MIEKNSTNNRKDVPIFSDSDIPIARQEGRPLALLLGFTSTEAIRVDTSNKDSLGGYIVAKRADGTDVKIKEGPADTPNTTWVKIRIGVFGDQGFGDDPGQDRRESPGLSYP